MQVRMTEAREASIDGTTVTRYEKGEVHDVPEDLAARWITRGYAEAAADTPAPTPSAPTPDGEKAAGAAPENRSRGAAPDDKTRGRSRRRTGGR